MALAREDVEQIQEMISAALSGDMESGSLTSNVRFELELRERIVRVEEELKHQRELMIQGFEQIDKRFEQIDKRFEQVDKRFEQVDKRFEQVDKRFEQVDKCFEQMDNRFEQMDKRFEAMDKRFETITQRLDRFMYWSFGITMSAAGIVIAALRLWPPG